MRRFFLAGLACILFVQLSVVSETLEELRNQFKAKENSIVAHYDELARQPGADKAKLTEAMNKALAENRRDFSALAGKDPRFSQAEVQKALESGKIDAIGESKAGPGYVDEINTKLSERGLKLKSTGGSSDLTPSHINADIDSVVVNADGTPATPEQQMEAIRMLEDHGVKAGDSVQQNAARFDNKGQDLTVWKPETPEGQAAKLTDHDAFKTEGGKYVTRNPGAVQDALGETLDNRSKFEAARVDGDLKTQGKSLLKAGTGEASGTKVLAVDADGNPIIDKATGKQKVVRKSDFVERNPELYQKAKDLKGYKTTHEAGITEVGDSPEVQKQKISQFQEEMSAEMDAIQKSAERKGKIRDMVRENFQDSYDKAGSQNPRDVPDKYKTDAELNKQRASEIQSERTRVQQSNQQASEAIAGEQAHPTSEDTFTGGRKGPGDSGYVEPSPAAAEESLSVSQRAQRALSRVNEMEQNLVGVGELSSNASNARRALNAGGEAAMTGLAVAGVAYEAGTLGYRLSKARILYEAAANAKDDSMAREYYREAQQLEQEAVEQAGTSLVVGAAAVASPVIVGGTLVGAGSYAATRAALENTETGKKIDETVSNGMQSGMESARDTLTHATGQDTYDEISEGQLTNRQSVWINALRRGDIALEEGVSVQDMLILIERNQDRIANPKDLDYLRGVVRWVKPDTPGPDEQSPQRPADDLSQAMLDAVDTQDEINKWKNDKNLQPGGAGDMILEDFTNTDSAGRSNDDIFTDTRNGMGVTPTQVGVEDQVQIAAIRDRHETRADADRRTRQDAAEQQQRVSWEQTIQQLNSALAQHNQQQADILTQRAQEAIALIQQVQNGTMNDEDFTNQLSQLEQRGEQLNQQAQQIWTSMVNQMVNDQLNTGHSGNIPGSGGLQAGNTGSGSGNDVQTILSSVPPDKIDTRQIECNSATKSGGDTPASITVDVGNVTGAAQISYDLYSVKDRIIVQYGGATLADTGCTNGRQTIPLQLSGASNQLHVVVQPACAGSGTSWTFTVSCPQGSASAAKPLYLIK